MVFSAHKARTLESHLQAVDDRAQTRVNTSQMSQTLPVQKVEVGTIARTHAFVMTPVHHSPSDIHVECNQLGVCSLRLANAKEIGERSKALRDPQKGSRAPPQMRADGVMLDAIVAVAVRMDVAATDILLKSACRAPSIEP